MFERLALNLRWLYWDSVSAFHQEFFVTVLSMKNAIYYKEVNHKIAEANRCQDLHI